MLNCFTLWCDTYLKQGCLLKLINKLLHYFIPGPAPLLPASVSAFAPLFLCGPLTTAVLHTMKRNMQKNVRDMSTQPKLIKHWYWIENNSIQATQGGIILTAAVLGHTTQEKLECAQWHYKSRVKMLRGRPTTSETGSLGMDGLINLDLGSLIYRHIHRRRLATQWWRIFIT